MGESYLIDVCPGRHRMHEERTHYRERTPWPGWVNAIFWGVIVLMTYPHLTEVTAGAPVQQRLLSVLGIVGVGLGFRHVFGGLTVLVQDTRIFLHFGSLSLIHKVIPFREIQALDSVHYHPIREFGGWGIRGWGKKKAWTVRGSEAVVVMLPDARLFYIGSDHPRRLEERIRSIAGEKLGAE
jgi:hypothetical protein